MDKNGLIAGADLALKNSGRLVRDGINALHGGTPATALVLGTYAIEELGRRQILLEAAANLRDGEVLAPKDIRARCDSHVRKLRRGQSFTHVSAPESIRAALDRATATNDAATLQKAMRILHDAAGRKSKTQPEERHARRMAALYVDVDDRGVWNTPSAITANEAYIALKASLGEYVNARLQITRGTPAFPEFTAEFTELTRALGSGLDGGGA